MLAPSQADDVPRAQRFSSVTQVTALPKGEPRHRILAQKKWSVSVSIRSIHCFTATLNARAARKSDGRKRFPSRHFASPCGRGGRAQRGRRGQITATSNRKMLAPSQADDVPRAQGSPQSPVVTALPKESQGIVYWHKKWSVSVSIRSPFTVLRLPSITRAARKSDGRRNGFRPGDFLLPPCGRGGRAQRGRRGQITATSNRKMLAPSQADDVPRAQGSLSHLGDSSPKGRAKASYIDTRNGAYLYRYASISPFYGYPSMRVPPESRMVVNGFRPGTPPCLSPVGEVVERSARTGERANNGNVQSENAGTFAGR